MGHSLAFDYDIHGCLDFHVEGIEPLGQGNGLVTDIQEVGQTPGLAQDVWRYR